jgi:hypothetical protein
MPFVLLAAISALFWAARGSGPPVAVGAAGNAPPTALDAFEPVLGMAADKVVVLGTAPQESSGETWAYGSLGDVPVEIQGKPYADQLVLLERSETLERGEAAARWQVVPLPAGKEGGPPGSGGGGLPESLAALGGRVNAQGALALLTSAGIYLRDPKGAAKAISNPGAGTPGEAPLADLLGNGESLPPSDPPANAPTPFEVTDEIEEHAGLLIAPYADGAAAGGSGISGAGVLHYDGRIWTREPISWEGGAGEALTPQALACSQPSAQAATQNCWLLASYQSESEGRTQSHLALFRRIAEGGGYTWKRQLVSDWLLGNAPPPTGAQDPGGVQTLGVRAQTLTVTPQGVWIDFQAKLNGAGFPLVQVSELVLQPATAGATAGVAGHWCFGVSAVVPHGCEHALEAALPSEYRSFAQAGGSESDPGTRVVTGLPGGAMLELAGAGPFSYQLGPGGSSGLFGAALDLSANDSIRDGVIGEGSTTTTDQQGQSQIVDVTTSPRASLLQSSPVPFRHPLLAITQGSSGEAGPGSPAIAVGADGEIGRYTPGKGWGSEALYNSAGEVQTPTLRGVAWPNGERAYAVGDNGAMWLWRADTGLWEPDPATPYNFIGNLTAIAFSTASSDRGYAVGKQGVLLSYGKTWEQLAGAEQARLEGELKLQLSQLDFTSIAFAGNEALASYRAVVPDPRRGGERVEAGGVLVEDGSGWRVDTSAASLLASLPDVRDTIVSKVAALADGGAVAAGPGLVIERERAGLPWRFSTAPLPEAQNVSALAAYRDAGGAVRAVVSIDLDGYLNPNFLLRPNGGAFSGDLPPPTGASSPPPHLPPDPLPDTGYVLKQTISGWSDMEHMALETASSNDMPVRPDPVLALQVAGDGAAGLAVGGQTVDTTGTRSNPDFETAAAMHFGPEGASGGADSTAAIATTTGTATFAVGGGAACEQPCASFAAEGLAPDALLSHALRTAGQIATGSPGGLRGFLYTGDRLLAGASTLGSEAFERELSRYATLLDGGTLPVYAAASPNDLEPGVGIEPFLKALAPFVPGGGHAYYSFLSTATSGGSIRVIVLDYSAGLLGEAQEQWLVHELQQARQARVPAIVMGNASLGFTLPEAIGYDPTPVQAQDAANVAKILVQDGASAYLFDYPGVNVQAQVSYGNGHIPAFGTGTLGYTSPPFPSQTDSLGSSGFLLLEVDTAASLSGGNVVPVHAKVEPNIGELAMDASDGTLLRRSQVGLFEALARIPDSGRAVVRGASGEVTLLGPEPYEPIPFNCLGSDCADEISSDYTFSSSKPDVGDFVAHEPGSANPRQILLSGGKPLADPHSGIFCAYNEGTTAVSVSAGGLTYSMDLTVQGGSSQYPCGTVPLRNPPARPQPASAGLPLPNLVPSAPAPSTPQIQNLVPPPPSPVPPPPAPHVPLPVVLPPVLQTPALLFPLLPLFPPPAPNVARPTPPSGTASVSQQVGVSEEEREEQGATELSHHMVAYNHSEESPVPTWPVALLPLILAAAIGVRGGGSSKPELARECHGGDPPR